MTRSRPAGLAVAALLLAACGTKDAQSGATTDSTAATAASPAAAPEAAPPSTLTGAPAAAQRGVDSANAAYGRQESAVDSLASQAGGGATP
jgi:hypothetical protein